MDRQFVTLKVTDAKRSAVDVFRRYDRTALPVVDADGILRGIVTIDDVLDVAEATATKEIQRIGGSEALDEPYMEIAFWRMIRNKLDSFQFMGGANGGRNLFEGLRSLALLYPLTFAVAKYNAANRGATRIESEDVDTAVATIEHSFGRSPALNQSHARSLEKALLEPSIFTRLVILL